jgi:hypothetical protein
VIPGRALLRDFPGRFGLFGKRYVSVGGRGGGSTNGWAGGCAGSACRHLQSLGVYCMAVPPKPLNNPKAMWR